MPVSVCLSLRLFSHSVSGNHCYEQQLTGFMTFYRQYTIRDFNAVIFTGVLNLIVDIRGHFYTFENK